MLDVIRAKSHSIVIKIAFGIIILVFCFWGVGSFTGGPSTEILTVNGQSLGIAELNQQLASLENRLRQQNPNLGTDDLRKMGIKKQAAQQMIFDTLIAQEAARQGIVLTPVELRHFIESLPDFHDKDGKFDPELYVARMNGQAGESAGTFEQRIASSLLQYKVQQVVAAGAAVPEATAKDIFYFGNERRVLEYVLFPKSNYTKGVTPSDGEIEAWYNLHQNKFKVPATADITYLNITPETLASKYLPSNEAVSAYYEKNKEQFRVPEQVRARHILFLSMKDNSANEKQDAEAKAAAEKAYNDLKNGADFAELAKKLSQDPGTAENGGELGWFERARMVPEFSEAAFALKAGEISKPVRTAYGYHIIQTEEARPSSIRPFEDVREIITKRLATEEASGQLQEVLDQILLAVLGGKTMEETASQYAINPITTGALSANELASSTGLKPEDVAILMATQAGTVRDTPFVTKKGYLLAKINASTPETVKKLADVKNEITSILTDEKQTAQAKDAAQAALLKKNADGKLTDVIPVVSDVIPRGGFIEALGEAQQLIREAFNAPAGVWLPNAFTVGNGAAIVKVKEVIPADDSMWETFKSQVMPALQKAQMQESWSTFMGILQNSAKVLLRNEKILED